FFGTTENAVKTQLWIAISVYVLIAIIKRRLDLPAELYTILQVLSVTILEKTPLDQLLANAECKSANSASDNQLNLFNY
ncbi:MAG: IS4 family transposase, partial [Hyphomicrobiaceae bacterium]|nr:IS4 family transposase [Hyphomicrobiaceae bacterium]